MGILAALRGKKTQSGDTPATPDSSKFAARSAAVLAVEQAVAGGGTPELQRKQTAKGIHIDATGGDYTFDLDAVHEGENQPEIKVGAGNACGM